MAAGHASRYKTGLRSEHSRYRHMYTYTSLFTFRERQQMPLSPAPAQSAHHQSCRTAASHNQSHQLSAGHEPCRFAWALTVSYKRRRDIETVQMMVTIGAAARQRQPHVQHALVMMTRRKHHRTPKALGADEQPNDDIQSHSHS